MKQTRLVSRWAWWCLVWVTRWAGRHATWLTGWLLLAVVCWVTDRQVWAVTLAAGGIGPGLVGCAWAAREPESYERWCAGPSRQRRWRRWFRREWVRACRACGLGQSVKRKDWRGEVCEVWIVPALTRLEVRGHTVRVTVKARAGQTLSDLETGAERLAATFGAQTYRTWPHEGQMSSVLVMAFVMLDVLTHPSTAHQPEGPVAVDGVRLGRTQSGTPWVLPVRGRHTLVAGCTGAGKGSVLWGICCGLAPAVRADLVRLWGIDLKRGVEVAMGEDLFAARAYTPDDALAVLRALLEVVEERGPRMAGTTRLHEPAAGDPLHVLVIDELAALVAYAQPDVKREANRLLAELLTQGRALGVVVMAFVQDPRKEVVTARGLFSQTVALRLRSAEEVTMTLGEGYARRAPAHQISPTRQGTAWVIEDNGATERVRADFWPDDLIRQVARDYATRVRVRLDNEAPVRVVTDENPEQPRVRNARSPRNSRSPRTPRRDAGEDVA